MTSANGFRHDVLPKGNGAHILQCPSDYEERPEPPAPKAPRESGLDRYTLNLSWMTPDDISLSLTIRGNDLPPILDDVKLIRAGIRIAREKAKGAPVET